MMISELTLFYEPISGRYFKSTISEVLLSIGIFELSRKVNNENCYKLKEWYEQLGLEPEEIDNILGWNSFKNVGDITIDIEIFEKSDNGPFGLLVYSQLPEERIFA